MLSVNPESAFESSLNGGARQRRPNTPRLIHDTVRFACPRLAYFVADFAAYFCSEYQAIWMFSRIFSLDASGLSPNSGNSQTILCNFGKLSLRGS